MSHFCLLQFDDHLISPKEFVHLAGKSTLKDWKRAIRMNGIMLRLVSSFVSAEQQQRLLLSGGERWGGTEPLAQFSLLGEGMGP